MLQTLYNISQAVANLDGVFSKSRRPAVVVSTVQLRTLKMSSAHAVCIV